ncbi:tryptophan--tRNA ligase, partial [Candidatus Berkelbacteria bacterium CG11_big_fil_rev_8_21_14_0_20_42_15]
MAKSAGSGYNYIALDDSSDVIRKKIQRAVTDSGDEIITREDKPAMTNLLNIFSGVS